MTPRRALSLAALLLLTQQTRAAPQRLLPPVTPACISSPFGPRVLPHGPLAHAYHNGIDMPAPAGQ